MPSAARFIVCRVNSYRLFWWWGLTGGSHMGLLPIGKYTRSWRTASRVSTCRQDGPHRVARYYARNVCTHTETKKSSFSQSGTIQIGICWRRASTTDLKWYSGGGNKR
ncbi:hypothetical protein JMJ77_0005625, partial [Colletotrichum scovillei]